MKKDMTEREERVELFKTVATFSFLAAAMFCLGGPLILGFVPHLKSCFRHIMIALSGITGFAIVVYILVFYCKLSSEKAKPIDSNMNSDKGTSTNTDETK